MSDQDHVGQVFGRDDIDEIVGEGLGRNIGAHKMLAFAEPGLRRGDDAVAGRDQTIGDTTPTPAAMPGAMNQDVSFPVGHSIGSIGIQSRHLGDMRA